MEWIQGYEAYDVAPRILAVKTDEGKVTDRIYIYKVKDEIEENGKDMALAISYLVKNDTEEFCRIDIYEGDIDEVTEKIIREIREVIDDSMTIIEEI